MKYAFCFFLVFFTNWSYSTGQAYRTKNIKEFGARGNGVANDHEAFKKAAQFFNARGGFGKLFIPKGTYLVGKQTFTGGQEEQRAYTGEDVLHLTGVQNVEITGEKGSILKYIDKLRFGSFDPKSGKAFFHDISPFVRRGYSATIGHCILIEESSQVTIKGISLDGNSDQVVLGGIYGDVGFQLPHSGVFVSNSRNIIIDGVKAHHFALDGICISNKEADKPDSILICNSAFEYNARQGLSWVGGNDLRVKNSKFNHTGKGKFASAPGAGVDIEAEAGPVRNGFFDDCAFIDNTGSGLVSDSGDGGYCTFNHCTFWGTTNWSVWVNKPGFTFNHCKIYGSMVHGYDAPDDKSATRFVACEFEDKLYNGQPPFGKYLVESNARRRMSFEYCHFTSNTKKACWLDSPESFSNEEKYQLINCIFTINNSTLPVNDFVGLTRGTLRKNCAFIFTDPEASVKRYYIAGFDERSNTDAGGNSVIVK